MRITKINSQRAIFKQSEYEKPSKLKTTLLTTGLTMFCTTFAFIVGFKTGRFNKVV